MKANILKGKCGPVHKKRSSSEAPGNLNQATINREHLIGIAHWHPFCLQ